MQLTGVWHDMGEFSKLFLFFGWVGGGGGGALLIRGPNGDPVVGN